MTPCSAVDRNGRAYTKTEMVEVFRKIYTKSPKAIALMFPDLTPKAIKHRAERYGMSRSRPRWTRADLEACRRLFPDRAAIVVETGKTLQAVEQKCRRLRLMVGSPGEKWSPEEDDMLRRGVKPDGRSDSAISNRTWHLGIKLRVVRKVRNLDVRELWGRIDPLISRGYPQDKRQDMVQHVLQECLEGRCSPDPTSLKACAKRAVTAVYKLHPDRGAPVSLDAQLFDDGGATVGDRISSDAFHF